MLPNAARRGNSTPLRAAPGQRASKPDSFLSSFSLCQISRIKTIFFWQISFLRGRKPDKVAGHGKRDWTRWIVKAAHPATSGYQPERRGQAHHLPRAVSVEPDARRLACPVRWGLPGVIPAVTAEEFLTSTQCQRVETGRRRKPFQGGKAVREQSRCKSCRGDSGL